MTQHSKNTKEQVRNLLKESEDEFISGEKLAKELSLSRNAVWKAIERLRLEGDVIKAFSNKGYCLSSSMDELSKEEIEKRLVGEAKDFEVFVVKKISSTNTELMRKGVERKTGNILLVADSQSEGRGRKNKTYFSPNETGVYFSALIRPQNMSANELSITPASAVALSKAVDNFSFLESAVKWVNDVYVDRKKVGGILTEAKVDVESSLIDFFVVGFGVNVYQPINGFPEDILGKAGYVSERKGKNLRNEIVSQTINNLMYYLSDKKKTMSKYREKLLGIGEKCLVNDEKNPYEIVGIDENFGLIVRANDGEENVLRHGEIKLL